MPALNVTGETWKDEVENASGKVLVDFWGNNCQPCKVMSPIIDAIADKRQDVKVVKVNFEDATDVAVALGLRGIPAFYLFENGQILKEHNGMISQDELESWLDES